MAHVDIELKGNGKALFQQPGRDEDTLSVAGINVAMAKCAFHWRAVKALRYQSFVAFANGKRHKVEGLAVQGGGNGARHRAHNPLQIIRGKHDLAGGGIADAVRRLAHPRIANDVMDAPELCIDCLTHVIILTYG